MAFYQVTDPALFQKINEILEARDKLFDEIKDFTKLVGCKSYSVSDHLYFGISFTSVGVENKDLDSIDKKKWKLRKSDNPNYTQLLPRKTNKEFYNLYESNLPKDHFCYSPLLSLLIEEDYCPFIKGGIGMKYKTGKYFAFESNVYTVKEGITEILASEYKNIHIDPAEQDKHA